jgi:hypothetical protein
MDGSGGLPRRLVSLCAKSAAAAANTVTRVPIQSSPGEVSNQGPSRESVVKDEHDHGPDYRNHKTVDVDSAYAGAPNA